MNQLQSKGKTDLVSAHIQDCAECRQVQEGTLKVCHKKDWLATVQGYEGPCWLADDAQTHLPLGAHECDCPACCWERANPTQRAPSEAHTCERWGF